MDTLQPLVWLRLLLAMLGLTAMKLARAWTVWEYTLHRSSIVPEATCRSSTPCRQEHLFTSSGWLVHAGTAGSACRCAASSHLQAWADHLQAGRSLMMAPHKCIF